MTVDRTAERIARNEMIFRDANENIRRSAAAAEMEQVPFICECADERCTALLRMTPAEYERVRAGARWFVNAPGHEENEADHARVVWAGDGYVVVEKTGEAGRIVASLDPRNGEGA